MDSKGFKELTLALQIFKNKALALVLLSKNLSEEKKIYGLETMFASDSLCLDSNNVHKLSLNPEQKIFNSAVYAFYLKPDFTALFTAHGHEKPEVVEESKYLPACSDF